MKCRQRPERIDPRPSATHFLLEVDEHHQCHQEGCQTEQVSASIDVRGHLDGRLEFVHIRGNRVHRQNVLALIVVGVIVPLSAGMAETRRIVCVGVDEINEIRKHCLIGGGTKTSWAAAGFVWCSLSANLLFLFNCSWLCWMNIY